MSIDIKELKDGDRVRVVFDATVISGEPDSDGELYLRIDGDGRARYLYVYPSEIEEIIKPLLREYRVGDVVRDAYSDDLEWTLGRDGYMVTRSDPSLLGMYYRYEDDGIASAFRADSKAYELVKAACE